MFRSLRYRNFRLFFSGQSISLIGTWMQKTAVSWLIYRITGSALLLGITGFASLIPSLILSPFAGSFIERHNRYKILVWTQIISMLQAGALAAMIMLKWYYVPGIIILTLIQGIINAFDVTCRQSLMMEMVEHKDDLPNAIALNATMTNFARITGPAVAGIVLSTLGEDVCFFSNFLSYIPVLISLFMMRLRLAPVMRSDKSIWFGLKEGFSYVSGNADLGSVLLMLAVSSLFVMPFNTLIPMFAKDIFNGNAETFSWFESAAGIGAIISAIYLANLKTANGMIRIMIMASLIFGVSVLFLAYTGWLPMALAFMTIAGIGMMALSSSVNTYIQTHAAPEMRSRAISYYIMAYQGMIPLGSLLVGLIAHKLGPQMTVAIEGVLGLVATVLFFFYRKRISFRSQVSGHLFLAKGNAA